MTSPKRKSDQDLQSEKTFSNKNKRLKTVKFSANVELINKISSIINKGFSQEETKLEERVCDIQNRICSIQEIIQEVRLAVVSSTYSRQECMVKDANALEGQTRIHPAVKKLLGIRFPKREVDIKVEADSSGLIENVENKDLSKFSHQSLRGIAGIVPSLTVTKQRDEVSLEKPVPKKTVDKANSSELTRCEENVTSSTIADIKPCKLPRYIPPSLKKTEICNSLRGTVDTSLTVIRLIVGNVSKWLPADTREDRATHKWMMYIRIKDVPTSSKFISKVRYLLDPSYKPNDLVEVTRPPFYLTRRGWGEFPVRVQVHFHNPLDKPVDIRHFLKLDTTHTGQENLGSETLVDVYLHSQSEGTDVTVEAAVGNTNLTEHQLAAKYSHSTVESENENNSNEQLVNKLESEKLMNSLGVKTLTSEAQTIDTSNGHRSYLAKSGETTIKEETRAEDLLDDWNSVRVKQEVDESIDDSTVSLSGSVDHTYVKVEADKIKDEPCDFVMNTCDTNMGPGLDIFYDDSSLFEHAFPIKEEIVETTEETEDTYMVEVPSLIGETGSNSVKQNNSLERNNSIINRKESLAEHLHVKLVKTNVLMNDKTVPPAPLKPVQPSSIDSTKTRVKTFEKTISSPKSKPQEMVVVKCLQKNGSTVYMTVNKNVAGTLMSMGSKNKCSFVQPKSQKLVQLSSTSAQSLLAPKKLLTPSTSTLLVPVKQPSRNLHLPSIPPSPDLLLRTFSLSSKVVSPSLVPLSPSSTNTSVITPSKQPSKHTTSGTKRQSLTNFPSLLVPVKHLSTSSTSILKPLESNNCKESSIQVSNSILKTNGISSFLPKRIKTSHAINKSIVLQNSTPSQSLLFVQTANVAQNNVFQLNNLGDKKSSVLTDNPQIPILQSVTTPSIRVGLKSQEVLTSKYVTIEHNGLDKDQITKVHTVQSSTKKLVTQPLVTSVLCPPNKMCVKGVSLRKANIIHSVIPTLSQIENVEIKKESRSNSYMSAETTHLSILQPLQETKDVTMAKSIKEEKERSRLLDSERLLYSGRTVVIKRGGGRMSSSAQNKDANTQRLQSVINKVVERPKFTEMGHAVSWFIRHFPIVHPSANDSGFKSLFPYCVSSADVFLQWLQPKQRAVEWQRAKTVQRALLATGYPPTEVWSTKAICLWAREHGFVPLVPDMTQQSEDEGGVTDNLTVSSTVSDHELVTNWMEKNIDSYRDGHFNDDIAEVDVINVVDPQVKVKVEPGSDHHIDTMEMSHELQLQCCHITELAKQLGFRFEPELITPGILYSAGERLMLQALKSFTEDLLRRSLAQGWKRNSHRAPASITPSDVKAAILSRPEFDIFTNTGLGIQPLDKG